MLPAEFPTGIDPPPVGQLTEALVETRLVISKLLVALKKQQLVGAAIGAASSVS